jgi:hypothetical protein
MSKSVFPQRLWNDLEDEFNLMPDYSGRAMYGQTCIALVGDTGDLMRFIAELIQVFDVIDPDAVDTVQSLADAIRTDSLGYDTVFYFPGITLEPEDDHTNEVADQAGTG